MLSSAEFSKLTFSKNYFRNIIRVSNSLDPDQDRHPVGPELGPNCLQRLSVELLLAWKELTYGMNEKLLILFDFILYVPVNNLSFMSGRVFLG